MLIRNCHNKSSTEKLEIKNNNGETLTFQRDNKLHVFESIN